MGKDTPYSGLDRRAEDREKIEIMDRLAGAVEKLVEQNGESHKALGEVKNAIGDIRINITELKVNQEFFIKTFDKQIVHCEAAHDDFETRLRSVPSSPVCADHKDRLEKLEGFRDEATKKIYKFMGIISVIVFILSITVPWALNYHTNKDINKAMITRPERDEQDQGKKG